MPVDVQFIEQFRRRPPIGDRHLPGRAVSESGFTCRVMRNLKSGIVSLISKGIYFREVTMIASKFGIGHQVRYPC